jgi:predicted component of type VI protein secretion system
MIHDLHLVVADLLNGEVEALYAGTDSLQANRFFDKAGPEVEAVRLFSYPAATRLRYPAKEALDTKARQALFDAQADTAVNAKRAQLAIAQAKHDLHGLHVAELQDELSALQGEPVVKAPNPKAQIPSPSRTEEAAPIAKPLTAKQLKTVAKAAAKLAGAGPSK